MKLHIIGFGDTTWTSIENGYTEVTGILTTQQLKEKRECNQTMLDIVFTLSYLEFYDIKKCATTKNMQDNLAHIYGGDKNVLRAKS